ncbi:arrestin [Lindgomyces ingoldianus]|uniref:Arrestin n=1 Tax=Lindgomyces ingoldianus TaxID=673940 RepID=A0ACB6QXB3_9PLEO|nr:arrestin [Lindgomyces ingoldianus]KAF2470922.1 arrestin [Lindgomyces ingoldianus]
MLVSISLEHPHSAYTNLDVVQGKIYLRVPNPSNVSNIVVKLEGESRTRLLAAVRPDRPDRQKPVLEVHKILYKTQVVWPANQLPEEAVANPKATYTLNAGQFEYPFQFKIPLNNACQPVNSLATNVNFSNMALEVARTPTHHVKQTLPPSLSGFPGEAEIRYYVKVTVNRPSLFKENPRALANLTFLPIEPPRPTQTDGEAYARRQHQFLENPPSVAAGKKKGFFDRKDSSSSSSIPSTPSSSGPPPRFIVDARLPNPAILTCNKDLPLRVLLKNMSPRIKNVYLQMLQIELIGYTKVTAHGVERTESNSWIVASFSNMNIPLGNPMDPVGTEVPINPEYWSGKPLPNTICPTFQTCNLQRYYELEVRVGLGYGSYKHGEDQLVVLPLRLPVKVYSGIAPPPALLEATLTGEAGKLKPSASATLSPPQQDQPPHTPIDPPGFSGANAFPPAQGVPMAGGSAQPVYDDAPPSYEDAIGQDLPPINGYRGNYQPPPVPEGAPRFSDEKRR